ncbi:MAG: hypothetical protein IPM35_10135 [Myxococcales bacterium]|nr:hypothetical protein [Myxococcales bacterium]
MRQVTGAGSRRAPPKQAGRRVVPGSGAAAPTEAAKKKAAKKADANQLVAGARVAKTSEAQLDESLRLLELPAGGDAPEKIRTLANFFARKQKELKAEEFDQCDVRRGVPAGGVGAGARGGVPVLR